MPVKLALFLSIGCLNMDLHGVLTFSLPLSAPEILKCVLTSPYLNPTVYTIPKPFLAPSRPSPSGVKGRRKTILRGMSGICRAGELTAILGPTGGGKSTLLDALAGRKTLDSGEVLLNGRRPGEDFKRLTGYCEQQDFLLGTLTVRETVRFSAELRLPPTFALQATPGERRGEIEARVAAVVKELGLEACADTMVGTQFVRGISGGEKKRTNLARELVTDPAIVFMDEPTTGERGREGGKEKMAAPGKSDTTAGGRCVSSANSSPSSRCSSASLRFSSFPPACPPRQAWTLKLPGRWWGSSPAWPRASTRL